MAYADDSDSTTSVHLGGQVEDYLELLKPRVMQLVVFTGVVGMLVAPGGINPVIGFIAILCIAVGAGPRARLTCGTMPTSTPS